MIGKEGLMQPSVVAQVESSPMMDIRPTEHSWLLKLTGPGSVGLRKNWVIEDELACGLSGLQQLPNHLTQTDLGPVPTRPDHGRSDINKDWPNGPVSETRPVGLFGTHSLISRH